MPLTRHRGLLPVACVAPVALVVALALAALGGVGLPQLLLGGGYAALVLGLGWLVGHDSSLVVAAATLAVAEQTMQPTQVSLWLRVSLPPRPGTGG